MTASTRCFVALDPPAPACDRLDALIRELAGEVRGVKWVAANQLHLTLAFLGDVPDERLADVGRAAAAATRGHPPFELRLQGLGAFPSPARPRVVWAGLEGPGLGELEALRADLVRELEAAGVGPADDRFSPHITVGRIRPGRGPVPDLRGPVERRRGWSTDPFAASELVVYASRLAPSGPTYTALHRAPLGGPDRAESP